jgi:hypothetical protein
MGKHIAKLGTICAVGAFALAPAAAIAAGGGYTVPKVSGTGTTKGSTKKAGQTIQKTKGSTLASKGLSIKVHFPKAGKITGTVKGGGKSLGTGNVSATKAGDKTLKITFSTAGKAWLTTHSGSKVTLTLTFKPTKGKSQTSSTTVTLG